MIAGLPALTNQRSDRPTGSGQYRRHATILMAISLVLAGCSDSSERVTPTPEVDDSRHSSPWQEGLAMSVNGPVPVITVDQFGYLPQSHKVAVLRRPVVGYDAGSDYEPAGSVDLVDAGSGDVVYSAPAEAWRNGEVDAASGDQVWWFDFTSVSDPGTYYVSDPGNNTRSPEFRIAEDVYANVLKDAIRAFFYQRAGQEKPPSMAGPEWADGASHLGPGQDGESRSWLDKDNPGTERDLRGGWYDAGDYNKYTAWHADNLIGLLLTYHERPDLVGDDLRLPGSGNGMSDLLDEAVWGLDWLTRMQQSDGSVLSVQGLDEASPPSTATGPSYYGPATTNATLKAAAALALASTVLADVPGLADRAPGLTDRALRAWQWAQANPSVVYFNNDETRQPGSGGLAAGQQETDDRGRAASRLQAAVYLYERTGQQSFSQVVREGLGSYLPSGWLSAWTVAEQETLLHFASLPSAPADMASGIRADYESALASSATLMPAVAGEDDAYLSPLSEYTWGSNRAKASLGLLYLLPGADGLDESDRSTRFRAAEGYLHYLHGVNPLGLVYLTNMGRAGAENSAKTLFHHWFADGTQWDEATPTSPGPAPGFLVGGPNARYSVPASQSGSPPADQPPAKSYLQFNDDWPLNSWEITENSGANQTAYIRLLASLSDWH